MKIISVGCSFTSAVGVKEAENYTSKLAEKLNCKYENFGEAGHSNNYIFRKSIDLFKNWDYNDILIVQWTIPLRQEIVTNEGYLFYPPSSDWFSLKFLLGNDIESGLKKIGVVDNKNNFDKKIIENYKIKVNEYWENFYNERYLADISFCFYISLFSLLEKMNIKYIMFFGWEFNNLCEDNKYIFNYTNDKFLKETFGSFTNTIGSEHPNADSHDKWAKFLYEKIKLFKYI